MKVFVTGGNGFIGSRVVHRLVADGHDARLLLRQTSKTHRLGALEFERHLGDVTDQASLEAGMAGCDAVIHLASVSSWEQIRSPRMREIVVGGTDKVLAAAKAAGGLRVVYVSSCTAIGGTEGPDVLDETAGFHLDPTVYLYAGAKHDAEQLCRRSAADGLPVSIVNPCEVYGPDDDELIAAANLLDTLKSWPALAVVGGTAVAHVDDIAGGIVAGVTRGRSGERYILGGENISIRQLIEITLDEGGQKKWILQLPNGLVKGAVKGMARLGLPTPVIPDVLDYATLYWFVDSGKAEEELGYTYRPAREAIGSAVRWLKESGRV